MTWTAGHPHLPFNGLWRFSFRGPGGASAKLEVNGAALATTAAAFAEHLCTLLGADLTDRPAQPGKTRRFDYVDLDF